MTVFSGYHSEWNLGSPGGWDYQRITQLIGKEVWSLFSRDHKTVLIDFDHPLLHPIHSFTEMLVRVLVSLDGRRSGFIAVVAEEETLRDVVENINLVARLDAIDGIRSALMAPYELERKQGRVSYRGVPVSLIFMDFNTNVLLDLHKKYGLTPLLQAVREGRVINPRGTEPINFKGVYELITDPERNKLFHQETIRRTPWTRQFYPRETTGPKGEKISDLVAWTAKNWDDLVLKPERGYSGKGVKVGCIHNDVEDIVSHALKEGDYIVQEKIPLNLWAESIPEPDHEKKEVIMKNYQTDFRCLFGMEVLYGFLGRFGGVPTNVGSGGGVQPLAVVPPGTEPGEMTRRVNELVQTAGYERVCEIMEHRNKLALDHCFTYLLGPIRIALRPRLITGKQLKALGRYCKSIWKDCLVLEKLWEEGKLGLRLNMDPEELEIVQSQPWKGSEAIFASDGLFSFGAHVDAKLC